MTNQINIMNISLIHDKISLKKQYDELMQKHGSKINGLAKKYKHALHDIDYLPEEYRSRLTKSAFLLSNELYEKIGTGHYSVCLYILNNGFGDGSNYLHYREVY